MDSIQLHRFLDNVRAFFLRRVSREVLVFLVFLLISASFWLLQTLNETYEMELAVPLRLVNVPGGTIVTTDLPKHLQVRLRDRGLLLWRYEWNLSSHPVEIDFSANDKGANFGHVVLSHADVQKQVASLLESTTRIVTMRPDTLEYYYTRGAQKRVAVQFRGRVETSPLFYLAGTKCEPDSVTVWGEEAMLDSLSLLTTVPTNIIDISETTVRQIPLAGMKGLKMEPDVVTLTAVVDVYTQKQVEVPIVGINFPSGHILRTFPSTATVSFRVGAMDYKKMNADDFALTVTYEELVAHSDSMLHLHLRTVPDGVSQVRIQPEVVQFMIEQTEE